MDIAILGAGSVGGNLARGWKRQGHRISLGVRDPSGLSVKPLLDELGAAARAATVPEAAAFGEVVVIATPWSATLAVVRSAGPLTGKVVIDATNPLTGELTLALGHTTAAAEEIAKAAPSARVVKCFNTTGANNFLAPRFGTEAATMFYCGDDAEAKRRVHELGQELGFDMEDAGPLTQARLLEPLALLWISLAYRQGMGREIAFRLMRR
jgi:predicted dinucleotide-binding enzyme